MMEKAGKASRLLALLGALLGAAAAIFLGIIRAINQDMPWNAEMIRTAKGLKASLILALLGASQTRSDR
jgi:hypothetical protein